MHIYSHVTPIINFTVFLDKDSRMNLQFLPVFIALITMTSAYPYIVQPVITLLYPVGIRFEIADQPGLTLVAIHYSINTQLVGVAGGQYNYDITVKTGRVWVHENHNVYIQIGFTVSYWVYEIVYGQPYRLLNQKWRASAITTTAPSTTRVPSTLTTTTTTTTTTTPATTTTTMTATTQRISSTVTIPVTTTSKISTATTTKTTTTTTKAKTTSSTTRRPTTFPTPLSTSSKASTTTNH